MSKDKKVRVAIVGVGNCATSLVQGVHFYKDAKDDDRVPGLMHINLGGYHICDIEFTAAFDVVDTKVGKDLSEAINAYPNFMKTPPKQYKDDEALVLTEAFIHTETPEKA